MISSAPSLLCARGMYLILLVVRAKSALGCICTKSCQEWLPHCSWAFFIHSVSLAYLSQGIRSLVSERVVLCGKSSNTPVTFISSLLSTLIVFPIGSSAPKRDFASDRDSMMEE